MKKTILFSTLILLITGSAAWSADVTAALDLNSAYVWRGITFNDGMVAQPSLDVSKGGFGFNVWGNFDVDDYDGMLDEYNFSEVDLTLSYSLTVKKLDIGIGLIEYLFPAGADGTREAYVSLGLPLFGGLSAGCDFYYDFDEVDSYYSDFTLTYALALSDQVGLEAGAKVGYAGEDYAIAYGGEEGGFYDYGFSLSISYALTETLSIGANIHYVDTMDEDVLQKADLENGVLGVDTELYGGVNISYTF